MRSVIIKKASQHEQQYQTTIKTNLNYIQNFMSILKKNASKLKIASDKGKTKHNNLYFTRKDMGPVTIKRLGNNKT